MKIAYELSIGTTFFCGLALMVIGLHRYDVNIALAGALSAFVVAPVLLFTGA